VYQSCGKETRIIQPSAHADLLNEGLGRPDYAWPMVKQEGKAMPPALESCRRIRRGGGSSVVEGRARCDGRCLSRSWVSEGLESKW
jgi:hypothetical protein